MSRLRLTEIFFSIQGESTFAGRPSAFVRLTGCDLRCTWCDSTYTFTGGTWWALDDIVAEVERTGATLVCVTGGEPLLQKAVHPLMTRLLDRGLTVTLETGGHRDLAEVDARVHRIVDLKPPGSGESERNRWENLALLGPRDELKCVLASREDYEWARDIVLERGLAAQVGAVLFSPVHGALDPTTLAGWILADRLPVRLQLQLHKYLWGADARGV
jgi:7-carboxy-7-deazaguanine synthase